MKLNKYLENYLDIYDDTALDFTMPAYECPKCKRIMQPKPKDNICTECGEKVNKWIIIPPKEKDESLMKTQVTGPKDIPQEKKDPDVSVANPFIYRGN